jgi:hypothetical protein
MARTGHPLILSDVALDPLDLFAHEPLRRGCNDVRYRFANDAIGELLEHSRAI